MKTIAVSEATWERLKRKAFQERVSIGEVVWGLTGGGADAGQLVKEGDVRVRELPVVSDEGVSGGVGSGRAAGRKMPAARANDGGISGGVSERLVRGAEVGESAPVREARCRCGHPASAHRGRVGQCSWCPTKCQAFMGAA